jgi:integrase
LTETSEFQGRTAAAFSRRIFGKSTQPNGEVSSQKLLPELNVSPKETHLLSSNSKITTICRCGSKRVWRDSHWTPNFGPEIQRWLCRDCGYRFSDPDDLEKARQANKEQLALEEKVLNVDDPLVNSRQICVMETKNLVADQKITLNPQRSELTNQSPEGTIINLLWMLQRENRAAITIEKYGYSLHQLLDLGVDLLKPDTFIDKMAVSKFSETRKYSFAKAYRCFLKHYDIEAKIPKYKPSRSLPYIPPGEYLDQIVACCNQPMACLFQTLKETAARPGEAIRMLWADLDVGNRRLAINHPEKGSSPRIIPISEKLLNMLSALPRGSKTIFPYKSADSASRSFRKMRKRAVKKLGNPELEKIFFYTCRYWRATLEYHKKGDFGAVMQLLGHSSLKYVLLYAQLDKTYFGGSIEYICKEAFTRQEAIKYVEAGYDLVMTDKEGVSLFRKIK